MAAPSSSQLTNDRFYTVYKTYNGKLRVPTIGFCPASWEKNSVLSYPKHRIGTNQKPVKIMHTQFEQMLRSFDGPANRPDIFWEQCECEVYHTNVATYADAQSHVKTLLAQEDTSTAGSASGVDYNAAGGRSKRRCTDSLATAAAKKNYDVMITVCNIRNLLLKINRVKYLIAFHACRPQQRNLSPFHRSNNYSGRSIRRKPRHQPRPRRRKY